VLRIRDVFIPYPGFEFFHPGSRVKKISDPDPHYRIYAFLTQKTVSKLSEKLFGMFIPDPRSGFFPPDPGFMGQKSTGSRIRIRNFGLSLPLWILLMYSTGYVSYMYGTS
jgi:hypothetical protein